MLPSLAVLLLPLLLGGCNRGNSPEQVGKPAPDFSVADGSRSVALHDYRGKVVVLNFWASWCAPCIEEMPSLNELQRRMPQVVVLGVSTDDDADAYRQYLAEHPLGFTNVRDASQRSNTAFGSVRFPESYVIDQQGRIRRKFIGAQDWTSPEILEYLARLEKNS